ncbi:hypothetical protein SAMN04488505_11438 [Chitinophaga rupis]|jgi:hypothetical protein|uniref:Uncharacterized protein n=1 Tax=Chitinophaga rupis TaxID=573321 RepID=A0A1H8K6H3_9BACT|nr:hypothetical protein SAMN04488505_11438 [Chitinophaga rupis]
MRKPEKKIISDQLHKSLIILFVGVTILMLLIKTMFL